MTNDALSSPSKDSYVLAEIWFGDLSNPTFVRFTNWSQDVVHDGKVFTSLPEMSVELPRWVITVDAEECKVTIPSTASQILMDMTRYKAFPRIYMRVIEVVIKDGTKYPQTLFLGRGVSLKRNAGGFRNALQIRGASAKGFLGGRCGIRAEAQCQWTFGSKACGVSVPTRTLRIDSINFVESSVTGTWIDPANPTEKYEHGWIEKDGIRIKIREQSSMTFFLVVPPPVAWDGENVLAYSGCTKDLTSCQFWSNEANFMGIGYDIPAYNPMLEDPGV